MGNGENAKGRLRLYAFPAVVVLQSLDVVFSEIIATLNLDEDQKAGADVFDAVRRTDRNVDGVARRQQDLRAVERDFGLTSHSHPVLGAPGVGKSRLVGEFIHGLQEETTVLRGRCLSYGEGVTYWALADMVRMRARIAEEEQPPSALAKLKESVARGEKLGLTVLLTGSNVTFEKSAVPRPRDRAAEAEEHSVSFY